jgi:hypothetical protein
MDIAEKLAIFPELPLQDDQLSSQAIFSATHCLGGRGWGYLLVKIQMLSNEEITGEISWPGLEPHAYSSKISTISEVASPTRTFSV